MDGIGYGILAEVNETVSGWTLDVHVMLSA